MMTKILVYGYCVGVFSSRGLQKRLQEDVAQQTAHFLAQALFLFFHPLIAHRLVLARIRLVLPSIATRPSFLAPSSNASRSTC